MLLPILITKGIIKKNINHHSQGDHIVEDL